MKSELKHFLIKILNEVINHDDLPPDIDSMVKLERTKDSKHGDFTTNIAMILAKTTKTAPRKLAELIVAGFSKDNLESIEKIEIAGAGFINFFIKTEDKLQIIAKILEEGSNYGCSDFGKGEKVLLEFLSANPTGPLHVGHGRIAAYGASLGNVLTSAGFNVTREYYVNDAGRQMNILAVSVWLRYLELAGEEFIFPVNAYKGDYVYAIAQDMLTWHNREFVCHKDNVFKDLPPDETSGGDKEIYIDSVIARAKELIGDEGFNKFHNYATKFVLEDIKEDLSEFRVEYDNWFSEQSLFDDGAIDKSIADLKATGHTFMQKGALWFKATEFGDEKDRVLIRANGQPTYFASDVAYHWNKYNRGFTKVIDAFGSDHHGYFTRLQAAMAALGHKGQAITILFVQFAILYRGGERVQMSTRSGSFVTLRELREEVGTDAARFFYALRKAEQHMDFDLDLAKSKSNDNPVYYIQYAHARICSVLKQLNERGLKLDDACGLANLNLLDDKHEQELIDLITKYPEIIQISAKTFEPHQIAYYLKEVATGLHSYYNALTLLCEDEKLRAARLCLLQAVRHVLENGLKLLGVSAPRSM